MRPLDKHSTKRRHSTVKSHDENTAKKAYRSPQLLVYGNIREITQSATKSGALADGSQHGQVKT